MNQPLQLWNHIHVGTQFGHAAMLALLPSTISCSAVAPTDNCTGRCQAKDGHIPEGGGASLRALKVGRLAFLSFFLHAWAEAVRRCFCKFIPSKNGWLRTWRKLWASGFRWLLTTSDQRPFCSARSRAFLDAHLIWIFLCVMLRPSLSFHSLTAP